MAGFLGFVQKKLRCGLSDILECTPLSVLARSGLMQDSPERDFLVSTICVLVEKVLLSCLVQGLFFEEIIDAKKLTKLPVVMQSPRPVRWE